MEIEAPEEEVAEAAPALDLDLVLARWNRIQLSYTIVSPGRLIGKKARKNMPAMRLDYP